jgi:hypothetical protein
MTNTAQSRFFATKDFVKREISESKTDIIKWVVGVFLALAFMIIGLYLKK